jgi:hypothetical protein
MAYTHHFQPFKTVLLVAGLRAGRPGEEKPMPLYSKILLISSIIQPTVTHKSSWEREKWPCARPMLYAHHFQPFKTVLLVAGLRAGRSDEEKPMPLYSQILPISSIIPPTATHKSSWERKKWLCAHHMVYARHFQPFKTVLLVAGLRAGGPGAVGRCSLMSKSRIFF